MLKSLFPRADWDRVEVIGFDLDGTLYDEAEFIAQVYEPLARRLAQPCESDWTAIYAGMLRRWLEKGSSYNRIFEEVLQAHGVTPTEGAPVVAECVAAFREFRPTLALPARTRLCLELAAEHYPLFLATDGGPVVQRAKFGCLGLGQWFSEGNVAISGDADLRADKPRTEMLSRVGVLRGTRDPSRVVYFGDRTADREFARNAGFQFIQVFCLHAEEGDA